MTRTQRWLTGIAIAVGVLVGGVIVAASVLLPSDEKIAAELGARFEQNFGIGLKVGSSHRTLWPTPTLALNDLATAQPQPITAKRVLLRLRVAPLWRREIAFDLVDIEGAVFPSASVRAFRGRGDAEKPEEFAKKHMPGEWGLASTPVEQLRWRNVTWIDRRDIPLAYDGEVTFDANWRPRMAAIRRPGVEPVTQARAERIGSNEDRWRVWMDVGGGTWNGEAKLDITTAGLMRVTGQFEAKAIDIESMVKAFDRRTPLAGKLSGMTDVDVQGNQVAEFARQLHTRTKFSVKPAALTRIDLAKAVSTAGISRGGRTPLDEFSGTLDTQGTDDGVILKYTNLKARSGVLTATGNVRLFNRKIDGDATVDIVDGVVGVPLKVAGTVDAPEVSLTGAALTGAAIGTAVLPGVGTAIGARIGQQVERMFGGKKEEKPKPRVGRP
ncbi:hypothetical protein BH11PSE13_BH11PSE13_14710 [soil metagenome]